VSSGSPALADRVALVVGGAGGIGAAIAEAFCAEGATVVIADRSGPAGEKAAAAVGAAGAVELDVTSAASVDAAVRRVLADHGRIDVLVNSAGILTEAPLVEMSLQQWQETLDVDLTGVFLTCRAVVPHMVRRGEGRVITIASQLGIKGGRGLAHYAAAKAGVMALTRCAAMDAAEHGIRINAVAPSLAMHPFLEKVTSAELLDELAAKEAFGRAAEPWEVANVIVFLASDYSSYLTGEVVSVSSQHP
jgi:3-oxoacyl-[acyl-carrier protein] reductase